MGHERFRLSRLTKRGWTVRGMKMLASLPLSFWPRKETVLDALLSNLLCRRYLLCFPTRFVARPQNESLLLNSLTFTLSSPRSVFLSTFSLGPVTRRFRLEKSRDETRRDHFDLVSFREYVSRDILKKYYLSRLKKAPKKMQKMTFLNFAKKCLCTVSRISSRLVTFGLATDRTRPFRISSRLLTCRLDLVSSRDFRLVTGSTYDTTLSCQETFLGFRRR